MLESDSVASDLHGVGSSHRWRHLVLKLMTSNPVNIALSDESTFSQLLSVAALGLAKLQKDPLSTELEVRQQIHVFSIHANTVVVSICSAQVEML